MLTYQVFLLCLLCLFVGALLRGYFGKGIKRFEDREIAWISLKIAEYKAKDEHIYKKLKSEWITFLNNEKAAKEKVSSELKEIFDWVNTIL